ncbi:MAG: hypothetical protein L0Y58_17770 [Verrucomicrobia subdivision 3 bacterium]|nr:hypothetical protein [Limisphaerales bacterium]
MTRDAQCKAKLQTLLADGSLPASGCGRAVLDFISPLFDGGVVAWRRSGGGRRLVVSDTNALRDFCATRFPEVELPSGAESRVAGVGRFRDSKATSNTQPEIISVRVWRNDALVKNGSSAGAAEATATHGLFSFPLTRDCPYQLRGEWALVENPAVFDAFEKLHLNADAVLYGHGRISNRTLDWIVRTTNAGFRLLHLPDYDPVGLSEFVRLRSRLSERVVFHLPTDLGTRFARFSKRKLLAKRKSQAMLARLRKSGSCEIRQVVELIDRHNAGLEQEALLLH